ncbi:hypothetical protein K432DRAFT_378584 [Lepidopterella palustris CBS 459.81]|uniref:Uncharacterized protein n=1 Tax=Lepidopterella palustris CBS 459.81 TaxID=1314670 RepID=A0A8E2EIV2_9PEZI|nr:hypothetical protein K432DRAFT_378584 [Lepidopterella palustris CBS 459.81]
MLTTRVGGRSSLPLASSLLCALELSDVLGRRSSVHAYSEDGVEEVWLGVCV